MFLLSAFGFLFYRQLTVNCHHKNIIMKKNILILSTAIVFLLTSCSNKNTNKHVHDENCTHNQTEETSHHEHNENCNHHHEIPEQESFTIETESGN